MTDTVDVLLRIDGDAGAVTELTVEGYLDGLTESNPERVELTLVAAVALSGHRVVTTDAAGHAVYADPSMALTRPLLVTTSSAVLGGPATAVAFGLVDEPSWSWTPDSKLYLAPDGALTDVPPPSGVSARVGWAVTPTRVFVHPGAPIVLAP